jgi:hypothetical protein
VNNELTPIHYDYDIDEESPRAVLWVAEFTHPHTPEPHCYQGAYVGFDDDEAIRHIEVVQGKTGAEVENYMRGLLYGE